MATVLNPGDIAIISYITNGSPDSFAFVNLVPLEAGTTLYFTDNGWTGTGFRNVTATDGNGSEGLIRFVVNATISAGTIIRSSVTSSSFTWTTSGPIAAGTGDYVPIDLAVAGDQIIAVQSTNPNNPLFSGYRAIAQIDNTGTFESIVSTSNESNVAPGLSQASDTAILLNDTASRFASFNPSSLPAGGTRDQWLDAINNPANWTFAASGTLPTGTLTVQSSRFEVVASSQKIADNTGGFGALVNNDNFGSSVAGVGDVDNDGVEDIVVGASGDNTGGSDRGAAYVLLLNNNGTVKASQKIAHNTGGLGTLVDGDYFGLSVAGVGDLDSDGVEDIVVGAFGDNTGGDNRGAAYVLLLNSNGTVKSSQKIAHNTGGLGALANFDNFGFSVAGVGDLDNDGVEDIVVGAYLDDTGGGSRGAAYVLLLNSNGTVKSSQKIAHNTGGFGALVNDDNFGVSVAGVGDLDNDGVKDIVVGAFGDDTGGINRGAAYVLLLNSNGTVKSSQKIAHNTGGLGVLVNGDNFGSSVAGVGDLDNDGVEDIVVGASADDTGGGNRGAAYVLLLNSDGTVKSSQKIAHNTGGLGALVDNDQFGSSVAGVGDLNNDGFADLAIGAVGDDTGGINRGATYILFGGSSNTAPTTASTSITFNEDAVYTFSSTNFPFTDPDVGNTLQRVRITQLPSAGQLFVDANGNDTQDAGEAVALNQEIAVANLNQLKFAPAAHANGTSYDNFQFRVSDGNALSAAAATMTINVTAVNDAPVLDNTGNMSLTAIAEDITNALNTGTTVADLIASAGGDRITDVDSNPLEGIAVTAVDNTNGTWQYSTDGTNWNNFETPSASVARLLQSDALIRFVPNANYNGTVTNGITFRAWDRTSGANGSVADTTIGGTAFSTAIETAAMTVTAVDDTEFVVTNTNDSGVGSLRWAIELANADPGAETIRFNIPTTDPNYDAASGTFRIRPTSGLPALTGQVTLDGYSQPGASANTLTTGNDAVLSIVLDGSNAGGANGLVLADGSDGSTIQGLVIQRFTQNGILIESGSDGNTIRGNFIGTDAAGTQDFGNAVDGIRINSANNTIGGNAAGDRNLISGNNSDGVLIFGSGATTNQIRGNYIGTDLSGTQDLGNSGEGVELQTANNTVGGSTAGDRNIISGNDGRGVLIFINGATGNQVRGNYIGTDATGNQDLGNSSQGIQIETANNIVGGSTAGDRNVISGNNETGIWINGSGATNNQVRGNYIGTNAAGNADLGNSFSGIVIFASNSIIGGNTAGDRNIISGNDQAGIYTLNATGNQIQGNYIGTQVDGTSALGNQMTGIYLVSSSNNTVGGTVAGQGNIIAFNGSVALPDGIRVAGGSNNRFLGNQIFANNGLAIDLGANGVSLNDAGDSDIGANNQQNFPVLTGVSGDTITGFLNSTPNTAFRVEFFSSATYDPSGAGEGETFLGFVDVTTDASGNAAISFTSPTAIGTRVITATATDPNGNTSEFSRRNQAPVHTLPSAPTPNEDVTLVFSTANGNAIRLSDADAGSTVQMTLTATNGSLTLGSTAGLTVTGNTSSTVTLSGSVANLNAALDGLSFAPTANYNGAASIQIVSNDNAPVQLGGALSDNDTLNFAIAAVNDAPVLDNTGEINLAAIAEDLNSTLNIGTPVVDLMVSAGGDRITDPDTGALQGIAVVAVDNTNGTWQYSINGTNWSDFATPSESAARLLQSDARIRFLPNSNYNGTVSNGIRFRAWDRSSGSNGGTADTTSAGGSTPFSSAIATAAITVAAENDAPTLNCPIADQTIVINTPFVLTLPADTFTDVEDSALTYRASLANGNPLPSWLFFEQGSRSFEGTPQNGQVGSFDLRVSAEDSGADTGSTTFRLTVARSTVDERIVGTTIGELLSGNGQNNHILGLNGIDRLQGGGGDDLLEGGDSHDVLEGGEGDDLLIGGRGNDRLFGGAGSDWFAIGRIGVDFIEDFQDGIDQILLQDGLTFSDLRIRAAGRNTEISLARTNSMLAIVRNVAPSLITASDFLPTGGIPQDLRT